MNENILYNESPAMFRNRPILFLIFVALIAIGIGLLLLIIWYIKNKGESLIITEKMVTLKKGILSKTTIDLLHKDVKTVIVSQSVFQRMFGTGSIGVASSGSGGTEIAISGVTKPQKAKEIIDSNR